jgi:hypothetical protein
MQRANKEEIIFKLEALPPDLRDLTRFVPSHVGFSFCIDWPGMRSSPPAHGLAPESALGWHPCIALSSARPASVCRKLPGL